MMEEKKKPEQPDWYSILRVAQNVYCINEQYRLDYLSLKLWEYIFGSGRRRRLLVISRKNLREICFLYH